MTKIHSFHIPVMGIGFTVDTPLKVSKYGIDSVISLVDDIIIEKMRERYCTKFKIPYKEITEKVEDFRAKRITSYLNLVYELSEKKFEELKSITTETMEEIKKYFSMLPNTSSRKHEFSRLTRNRFSFKEMQTWLKENMRIGEIGVNIMTKLDKNNYIKNKKLPIEYNDAHAALRGFANSKLNSSLILSAGMNPRLYAYMEQFDDFFPDETGKMKKRIVLKVSDYRSAFIQGKFLAKKGLWVSEYRIESGLNCGGHAFATEGYLLGPVLEEFKEKKSVLKNTLQSLLIQALSSKNKTVPRTDLDIRISAQGGVGTQEEHQFLMDYYDIDSIGWGTPFLLVPEATTVDKKTLNQLEKAKEDDIYLSNISPLGVSFNSLKGNTKDLEKKRLIEKGRPGSSCPKKFVALNKEFSEKGLCMASRQYQYLKLKELEKQNLSKEEYKAQQDKITEKSCICVGLGTSALLAYGMDTKTEGKGVSICPGPNIAYFSKAMSLKEITDVIYGRADKVVLENRPNMFIKELDIYIQYLTTKLGEKRINISLKDKKYLQTFAENLKKGIEYYYALFNKHIKKRKDELLFALEKNRNRLDQINVEIKQL